ncbi:MAG TPA: DUF6088 family protein [Planctomycetota bacterium]|nr:DUF6088 family protein [Planctomycetota bacterium]
MGKHAQSIDSSVLRRIRAKGRGSVVSAGDLLDLGSRSAVTQALSRNVRRGVLRKVGRGLYELPPSPGEFGMLPPSVGRVADALARRDGVRIQPSGAHAANLLGLSAQVPVRAMFVTDGRARTVTIGKRQVVFKRVPARRMAAAGRMSGTVMHALLWLGKKGVNDGVVQILRRRLGEEQKRQLLKDLRYAPTWVAEVMRKVAVDP